MSARSLPTNVLSPLTPITAPRDWNWTARQRYAWGPFSTVDHRQEAQTLKNETGTNYVIEGTRVHSVRAKPGRPGVAPFSLGWP